MSESLESFCREVEVWDAGSEVVSLEMLSSSKVVGREGSGEDSRRVEGLGPVEDCEEGFWTARVGVWWVAFLGRLGEGEEEDGRTSRSA